MPTFIVKNNPGFKNAIVLFPEDEHHLVKVLRAHVGEHVEFTDNQGTIATAVLKSLHPFRLAVISTRSAPRPVPLTICLPVIERARLEFAIEKLTELNVETIQLMLTARTQKKNIALARLQKIATAAQKQCGRAWPVVIEDVVDLNELATGEKTLIVAHQGTSEKPTHPHHEKTTLLIGPEGGFSPAEITLLQSQSAHFVSLGPLTLRTETAAVALTLWSLWQ